MKICYIAAATKIHTQRWVKYFADRDHEIHLISPMPLGDGDIGKAELHVLKRLPLQIRVISPPINLLLYIIQIKQLIREIKPDILHAHFITDCGFWGALSGFHPFVLSAWGSDILVLPRRSFLTRVSTKYSLRKADLVICDSETLRKGALELGTNEGKIRIVYDGIDTQQFNPQQRDEGLKNTLEMSGAPTIICIRHLVPLYNVEMLIKAIPMVLEKVPETRFIIGGEGKEKRYLQDLAKLLGVSSTIKFVGWIPHNELPKFLASSDVYVSTSHSDSTSLSLQESMACELPPVVTDLPANREWVTDGENGFLIPVGDHETLATKVVHLLTNKEMRSNFGKTNRKIIIERAEHQREMERMEKIYQHLIGANK
jgi:glycosyltransferase involved in cell wall biosynthesis